MLFELTKHNFIISNKYVELVWIENYMSFSNETYKNGKYIDEVRSLEGNKLGNNSLGL